VFDRMTSAKDRLQIRSLFRGRHGVPIAELLSLRFRVENLERGFFEYYLPISLFQSQLAFSLASILLIGDYASDSFLYGISGSPGNYLRIPLSISCILLVGLSYYDFLRRYYELYISAFYIFLASFLFYILYLIDKVGGNGIVGIVGFLNLFFILIFGFVLIGTRFYYSTISAFVATAAYVALLCYEIGATAQFYYYVYQIVTVFLLCVLLGYTRELILRADFATQAELARARLEKEQDDARYLEWLKQLAKFLRHEVRNPVAQINSSLELIQLGTSGAEVSVHISNASMGIHRVWNLIERASQATDIEAFVRKSSPSPVDIAALVRNFVERFQKTCSGLEFALRVPEEALMIDADPILLEEALSNLLQNAASFADEESTVEICIINGRDDVKLEIVNRGPLIQGDSEQLFNQFASTRSGENSEHHGLGLYMVRLICEHYGGRAAIDNLADRSGVCATLALPSPYGAPRRI
jgi:signal transduction histidine kinase